jgi:hypothetical protein
MSEEIPSTPADSDNPEAGAKQSPEKPEKPKRPRRHAPSHKDANGKTRMETGKAAGDEASAGSNSMERADQIVAEWSSRAEQIGTEIGHRFVRLVARAREEAEDIWAEAQELRRREDTQQVDGPQ